MSKHFTRGTSIILIMALMLLGVMAFGAAEVNAASKKPGKPSIKLSHYYKDVTIRWKKCKNAKNYEVWQRIGSGKWKKVKTTSGKKYSKIVKYNKKYYFRVRAINKKSRSGWSNIKNIIVKEPTVTFNGETFKLSLIDENGEPDYSKRHGWEEWVGETSDGLEAVYEKNLKTGFVQLKIYPKEKSSKDCGSVGVSDQSIYWGMERDDMSVSFTIDGKDPAKGIGEVNGSTYFYRKIDGKFTVGRIDRYKMETIVGGSCTSKGCEWFDDEDEEGMPIKYSGQFNYGALLNTEGLPEECYKPYSEENIGGSHIILEDGKTFWEGYSTSYQDENVNTDKTITVRARMYRGNTRICEIYKTIMPDIA